jgi:putative transposase
MKRLRQLEEENGKLKKIVADLSLDEKMLQDVIRQKPVRKRQMDGSPRDGVGGSLACDPRPDR